MFNCNYKWIWRKPKTICSYSWIHSLPRRFNTICSATNGRQIMSTLAGEHSAASGSLKDRYLRGLPESKTELKESWILDLNSSCGQKQNKQMTANVAPNLLDVQITCCPQESKKEIEKNLPTTRWAYRVHEHTFVSTCLSLTLSLSSYFPLSVCAVIPL